MAVAVTVDRLRDGEQQVEQGNVGAAAARRVVQQRRILQLGQVSVQRTVCFRAHDQRSSVYSTMNLWDVVGPVTQRKLSGSFLAPAGPAPRPQVRVEPEPWFGTRT